MRLSNLAIYRAMKRGPWWKMRHEETGEVGWFQVNEFRRSRVGHPGEGWEHLDNYFSLGWKSLILNAVKTLVKAPPLWITVGVLIGKYLA